MKITLLKPDAVGDAKAASPAAAAPAQPASLRSKPQGRLGKSPKFTITL
jgi:hypothetical protein